MVTITGNNFDTVAGTTKVAFGAHPATYVHCSTTTTCVAISPPGTGAVYVTVTENGLPSPPSSADSFTYVKPPVGAISCGATITHSVTLHRDLGPCPGNGLVIKADNVTVNLAGHRIFGIAGAGDNRVGVQVSDASGVTVTGGAPVGSGPNGQIDSFDSGVAIDGGSHNTITDLSVHDNIGAMDASASYGDGIVIGSVADSADNVISKSSIVHNGIFDGVAVFGATSTGNRITNDQITDNNVLAVYSDGSQDVIDEGVNLGVGFSGSNNTTITGNVISRNGADGIRACSGPREQGTDLATLTAGPAEPADTAWRLPPGHVSSSCALTFEGTGWH